MIFLIHYILLEYLVWTLFFSGCGARTMNVVHIALIFVWGKKNEVPLPSIHYLKGIDSRAHHGYQNPRMLKSHNQASNPRLWIHRFNKGLCSNPCINWKKIRIEVDLCSSNACCSRVNYTLNNNTVLKNDRPCVLLNEFFPSCITVTFCKWSSLGLSLQFSAFLVTWLSSPLPWVFFTLV